MRSQYPLVDQGRTVELADVDILQVQVVPGVGVGSALQSIQVGMADLDPFRQERQLQSRSDIVFTNQLLFYFSKYLYWRTGAAEESFFDMRKPTENWLMILARAIQRYIFPRNVIFNIIIIISMISDFLSSDQEGRLTVCQV